jgi:hypothetical protein
MSRGRYIGGHTILTNDAKFRSFDPAEGAAPPTKSKKSERLKNELRGLGKDPSPPSYKHQLSVQRRILIGKILAAVSKRKMRNLYIPRAFADEVAKYPSIQDWAHAQQEYSDLAARFSRQHSGQKCLGMKRRRQKSARR